MPTFLDIESDMEALDAYLMSDASPPDCMMLHDLDGVLTSLVVGPELIPVSEWMPHVWGGQEPVFENAGQAEMITGSIIRRQTEIMLQVEEGRLQPIFGEMPGGEIIAADWAAGFMDGVRLRPNACEKLFKSRHGLSLILPIAALCCDEEGEPFVPLPSDLEDEMFEAAPEVLPECVLDIADFWRPARTAFLRQPQAPKAGRNDPCPCGSGKKFKKCYGME
jgi:uncharacterized protein